MALNWYTNGSQWKNMKKLLVRFQTPHYQSLRNSLFMNFRTVSKKNAHKIWKMKTVSLFHLYIYVKYDFTLDTATKIPYHNNSHIPFSQIHRYYFATFAFSISISPSVFLPPISLSSFLPCFLQTHFTYYTVFEEPFKRSSSPKLCIS